MKVKFILLFIIGISPFFLSAQDTCLFISNTITSILREENVKKFYICENSAYYPISKVIPRKIKKEYEKYYKTDSSLNKLIDYSCDCFSRNLIENLDAFKEIRVNLFDSKDYETDSIDKTYRNEYYLVYDSLEKKYEKFKRTPEYIKYEKSSSPIALLFTGIFFIGNEYVIVGFLTFKQPIRCIKRTCYIYKQECGNWNLVEIINHDNDNKITRKKLRKQFFYKKKFKNK